MFTPSIGRIVLYTLNDGDAERINRRRTTGKSIAERMKATPAEWPAGAQAHIGNDAIAGQEYPLLITRVWPEAAGVTLINGQVLLDGNDALWVTSVHEATEPAQGQYRVPPRT